MEEYDAYYGRLVVLPHGIDCFRKLGRRLGFHVRQYVLFEEGWKIFLTDLSIHRVSIHPVLKIERGDLLAESDKLFRFLPGNRIVGIYP